MVIGKVYNEAISILDFVSSMICVGIFYQLHELFYVEWCMVESWLQKWPTLSHQS